MRMQRIKCRECGGYITDVDPDSLVVRCGNIGCGAVQLLMDDRTLPVGEGDREQTVAKLLSSAGDSLDNWRFSQAARAASEVLLLDPGHFLANFYLLFAQRGESGADPRDYESFLKEKHDAPPEQLRTAAGHALSGFRLREANALGVFIDQSFSGWDRDTLRLRLKELAALRILQEENYALIPRDVFICLQSDDLPVAEKICDMLTGDGISCWIYTRNMPPHCSRYGEVIRYAIGACKVFLVVASYASMHLSEDVKEEIRIASGLNCARLEFKVDGTEHTGLFSHFFKGITWIEGQERADSQFERLKEAVRRELFASQEAAPRQAPPPALFLHETDRGHDVVRVDESGSELGRPKKNLDHPHAFLSVYMKVSGTQCRFLYHDGLWHVADAGSKNGTFLKGLDGSCRRLEPQAENRLADGMILNLAGQISFRVRYAKAGETPAEGKT